ncbi:MAG: hypothetical protein ABIE94_04325 [archaeon]
MADDDLGEAPMAPEVSIGHNKKGRKALFKFIKKKKKEPEPSVPETNAPEQMPEIPDDIPDVPSSPFDAEYKKILKEEKVLKNEDKALKKIDQGLKEEELEEDKAFEELGLEDVPPPPSLKVLKKTLQEPKPIKKAVKPKKKPAKKPVKKILATKKPVKKTAPKSKPALKAKPVPKPAPAVVSKPKPQPKPKKKMRVPRPKDEMDIEIEKYFGRMEKEQITLKNQLDKILPGIKPLKLVTGEHVRSLRQLKEAVEKLDKETFQHHLDHNDFYKWVKNILKEEVLAEKLRSKIVKREVLQVLREHEEDIKNTIRSKEIKILQDKRFRQGLIKELKSRIDELHDLAVTLARKDKYLKSKQKNISASVKKATKARVEELDRTKKNLDTKEKNLDKNKNEFSKKQDNYKKATAKFEKDRKEAQKLFDSAPGIKKRKQDIEKQEKDFKNYQAKTNKNLKTWESSLKKEKARLDKQRKVVERQLKQREKIESYFKNVEGKLKNERSNVEEKGFGTYLQAKLKEIGDVDVEEAAREERPMVKGGDYFEIYRKIDKSRDLLDASKIEEAKKLYQKIKEMFYNAKLTEKEKPILYNAIRELYDDIHLAVLEQY